MSVTVFGSLMVDLVWRPPRLPTRGETVLCSGFTSAPGGKGANQVSPAWLCRQGNARRGSALTWSVRQALAAARAGVTTRMIGAVGDDAMAPIALEVRRRESHGATDYPTSGFGFLESSRASPPHRPREDGLAHPADSSRTNLAAALGLLSRWRLSKPC
jgi:hypothetical protein